MERTNRVDRQLVELGFGYRLSDSGSTHRFAPGRLEFQLGDLAQTADVSRGVAELRCQECLHQVPGHFRPYRAATHAEKVHIVVFDALPGGEVIMNQGCANPRPQADAQKRTGDISPGIAPPGLEPGLS
jgi:hypothetical protein